MDVKFDIEKMHKENYEKEMHKLVRYVSDFVVISLQFKVSSLNYRLNTNSSNQINRSQNDRACYNRIHYVY